MVKLKESVMVCDSVKVMREGCVKVKAEGVCFDILHIGAKFRSVLTRTLSQLGDKKPPAGAVPRKCKAIVVAIGIMYGESYHITITFTHQVHTFI